MVSFECIEFIAKMLYSRLNDTLELIKRLKIQKGNKLRSNILTVNYQIDLMWIYDSPFSILYKYVLSKYNCKIKSTVKFVVWKVGVVYSYTILLTYIFLILIHFACTIDDYQISQDKRLINKLSQHSYLRTYTLS